MKNCSICNQNKPLILFRRDTRTTDGRRSNCKSCRDIDKTGARQRDRKWYARNKHRRVPQLLLKKAKRRAKFHGLNFNLMVEDVIVPTHCPVFGMRLKPGVGKICDESPTIDRIAPDEGYVVGNIEVISYRANRLKNNGSLRDFEQLVVWLRHKSLQ